MLGSELTKAELEETFDEIASILEDESLTAEEQVREIAPLVFGDREDDED